MEQLVAALVDALKQGVMQPSPQQNDPVAPVPNRSGSDAPSSPSRANNGTSAGVVLSPPPAVLPGESFPTWPSLDQAREQLQQQQRQQQSYASQMESKEQSPLGFTSELSSPRGIPARSRAAIASPRVGGGGSSGGGHAVSASRSISPRSAQQMVRSFMPSHRPTASTVSTWSETSAAAVPQTGNAASFAPGHSATPAAVERIELNHYSPSQQERDADQFAQDELRRRVAEQQALIENLEAALAQSEKARLDAEISVSTQQLQLTPQPPQQSFDAPSPRRAAAASSAARAPSFGGLSPTLSSSPSAPQLQLGVPVDAATSLAAQRSTLRIQQQRLARMREELEAEKARVQAIRMKRDPSNVKPAVPTQAYPTQQPSYEQLLGRSPSVPTLQSGVPDAKYSRIPQLRDAEQSFGYTSPDEQLSPRCAPQQPSQSQQQQQHHPVLAVANYESERSSMPPKSTRQLLAEKQRSAEKPHQQPMQPSQPAAPAPAPTLPHKQSPAPAAALHAAPSVAHEPVVSAPPLPAPTSKAKALQRKLLRLHLFHCATSLFAEDVLQSGALLLPPDGRAMPDAFVDALLAMDAGAGGPFGPQAAQKAMALVDALLKRRPLPPLMASLDELAETLQAEAEAQAGQAIPQ